MPSEPAPPLTAEHLDFYERFKSFWAAPTGPRVAELIAPDATIYFTGAGTFSGAEYVDVMAGMIAAMADLTVTPLDCAGNGDRLYISWQSSALIEGERRTWLGVDRFRLKNGMAVEEQVIFDSAALQPAFEAGTGAGLTVGARIYIYPFVNRASQPWRGDSRDATRTCPSPDQF